MEGDPDMAPASAAAPSAADNNTSDTIGGENTVATDAVRDPDAAVGGAPNVPDAAPDKRQGVNPDVAIPVTIVVGVACLLFVVLGVFMLRRGRHRHMPQPRQDHY